MENNLQVIDPKEYGIEKKQAKELTGNLPQIVEERSELEKRFSEVIKLDLEDEETPKVARELRLLVQKNRTKGINVWHKTAKDFFLKGGQFVDAIKRKEIAVNERMEADLLEMEQYAERKEQERLEALQKARVEELTVYFEEACNMDLKSMPEDVYQSYLATKKKEHQERIEQERLRKEQEELELKKSNLRVSRLAKINSEGLRQFMPDNYLGLDFGEITEDDYNKILLTLFGLKDNHEKEQAAIKAENERLKKEKEERDRLEAIENERIEKERIEREEQAKKEREEMEAKLEAERKEKEKAERELREKQEAEDKAKREEEARIQAELEKGDAEKVIDLKQDLEALKSKYTFDSDTNKKMYIDVSILIDKILDHINK